MPHIPNPTLEIIVYITAGVVLLFIGYRAGRFFEAFHSGRRIAQKEQELFTTQKGFRTLYEQELANSKSQNDALAEQVKTLTDRVEEYRKKAAGFGGLFNAGGKRSDAMYALLLENEALEEALYSQNEKLRQERTDSLKEQMRSTGYRRVLMSQLMNDQRIKSYVAEILADQKRLPAVGGNDAKSLPAHDEIHEG
jgi:cell division protein FtsB